MAKISNDGGPKLTPNASTRIPFAYDCCECPADIYVSVLADALKQQTVDDFLNRSG